MGLFTSNCKNCNKKIEWFLESPKAFKCECGTEMNEKEINDSWLENYRKHLIKIGVILNNDNDQG